MPALLDVLRGRMRDRELHAVDLIAEAARAAAAGKTYDVAALESALDRQGMTVADFEKAVETARRRALWLSQFDGLAAAASRAKKLEAAIQAEEEKFEEYRRTVIAKASKIREELAIVTRNRDAGENARGELLNPAGVPGTVGIRYRELVAERDAAQQQVSTIAHELRQARERLESRKEWVDQTASEGEKRLEDHVTIARRQAKLDEHEARVESAARRVAEIEGRLAAAEKDLATIDAAVKKMEIEVLNT